MADSFAWVNRLRRGVLMVMALFRHCICDDGRFSRLGKQIMMWSSDGNGTLPTLHLCDR